MIVIRSKVILDIAKLHIRFVNHITMHAARNQIPTV